MSDDAPPTGDVEVVAPDAPDASDASGVVDHAPSDGDRRTDVAEPAGRRPRLAIKRYRARRRRRAIVLVLVFLVLPLAFGAYAVHWWSDQLDGGTPGAPVELTIEHGWSVKHIADVLADRDVIGSSWAFQMYARIGGHNKYEAGEYTLRQHLGIRRAVQELERGPVVHERVLQIVPSQYLDQVAAQVHRQLGLDAAAFIRAVRTSANGTIRSKYQPASVKSLEGLLFPDTYRLPQHATIDDVLRTMVGHFDSVADQVGLAAAARAQGRTPYQVIVTASIIEREARVATDGPLIASVIANRIKADMPLQIDATTLYAKRFHAPQYDTYQIKGLPPGPIATFSRQSLVSAAHPATTPYKYYVIADAQGHHAFSATYDQFQRDVAAAKAKGLL